MADIATIAAVVSAASAAAGAGISAGAARTQGKMAKQVGDYNAKEYERAAQEQRAEGYRKSQERQDKLDRVMSAQRASFAVSGTDPSTSPGYLDLVGDTAQRGAYLSELEIASGEQRARGLEGKAIASRWEGDAKSAAYGAQATGALVKGAFDTASAGLKLYDRLGGGSGSDLLLDETYPDEIDGGSGWRVQARRAPRGRYY